MKVLNTFFKVAAFSFVTVALAAMPIKMKAQTDAAIRILNPNPVSYALGAVDSVVVQINNVGQDTIYNLGIVWGINGVFQNHVYFSTMPGLASGDSICIVIGMITYPIYPVIDICAFIAGVHGLPDINPNNDTSCVSMVVDFEIEAIANSSVGNCLPAGMPVIQTVLVTNKGNIDVHNIPLMLVVSDNNGAVLDVQYGTLNVLLAGTAALVTFPMPYIVPFSQNYTVIAGIGDKSQFYFSDTLTECADTAAMTSEISGKIFRQDSTPVTSGEVRLYYPYFAWQYYSVASVPVANDGSYSFTTVYTGNYLIKFVPDSSENALPTYYGNTEFWYLADTVTVSDTLPIQNIDIFIIPQSSLSNGSSFISGYVGQKDGQKSLSQKSVSDPAEDVCVYLQKENLASTWTTIDYTLTNAEGYFEFRNVSAGRYRVILDVPGLETDNPQIVEVGDGDTIQNIEYEITEGGITNKSGDVGISNYELGMMNDVVYPNPTTGKLHITTVGAGFKPAPTTTTNIELFDVVGQVVGTYRIRPENTETTIDISHLSAGMYFLKIDGKTFKVVKE